MSKKGLGWRFLMDDRGPPKMGFFGGPGGAPGGPPGGPPRGPPRARAGGPGGPPGGPPPEAPWDKHPLGCIRGHSGVSRGVPIEPPGYPQNDRFRAELYLVYCRKRGGLGGTVYTPHMAMYSAMMFVPTHTMFVPNPILSQKCKKTEKIGVPCLSRMGDLLNTRRNVQNFVPGGVPGGSPPGGPILAKTPT